MLVEITTPQKKSIVHEISDETMCICFHENDNVRISISSDLHELHEVQVDLGALNLQPVFNSGRYFFSPDPETDKKTDYFRRLFSNEFGYQKLKFRMGNKKFEIDTEVKSSKVNLVKMTNWLNTVLDIFPIIELSGFQDALSEVPMNKSISGFSSIVQILKEFENILDDVSISLRKPNYLQTGYEKKSNNSANNYFSVEMSTWLGPKINWKKTRYSESSVRKLGSGGYVPINPPSEYINYNYDHTVNKQLYSAISKTILKLKEIKSIIDQTKNKDIEVRNSFATESTKNIYQERLLKITDNAIDSANKIRIKLNQKQIFNGVNKPIKNFNPNKKIYRDQKKLNELSSFINLPEEFSEHFKGIPSIDYVFEYFCLANILKFFIWDGFIIETMEETGAVPGFLKLLNEKKQSEISIYYDFELKKRSAKNQLAPLIESSTKQNHFPKRPDFIIARKQNGTTLACILDAKYKSKANCRSDHFGSKMNNHNLVAKYSSNICHNTTLGLPPVIIGALCLSDSNKSEIVELTEASDEHFFSIQQTLLIALSDNFDENAAKTFIDIFNNHLDQVENKLGHY